MADEAILAKQRYFQSVHKLTHLKSPTDKFTSVAIPFALVGIGAFMMMFCFLGGCIVLLVWTSYVLTSPCSCTTVCLAIFFPAIISLGSMGRGLSHLYTDTGKKDEA